MKKPSLNRVNVNAPEMGYHPKKGESFAQKQFNGKFMIGEEESPPRFKKCLSCGK
jgi:hypothetical protein